MKCLRRFFCALFSCALLLTAFSITASAELVKAKDYHVYQSDIIKSPYNSAGWTKQSLQIFPNDGTIQKVETSAMNTGVQATLDYRMYHQSTYQIANNDKSALFTGGRLVKLRLENARHYLLMMNKTTTQAIYYCYPDTATFSVKYKDGSTETFDGVTASCDGNDGNLNFYIEFTPSKDVYSITFTVNTNFYKHIQDSTSWATTDATAYTLYIGEWDGDNKYQLSIEQSSEESGLLSGLIGWVKNIFDSVKDGFSALGDGLNNVWNSVLELPSKIWEFIENGLKKLFVPTEEYIVDFKERIDSMLSQKLGAVYQVINLLLESWDRINVSDATDTIEMPQAKINVGDGEEFAFGGYDVQVVPDGFDTIVNLIKLIVGISCTVLFVNGLRHRYDEVMGVEK